MTGLYERCKLALELKRLKTPALCAATYSRSISLMEALLPYVGLERDRDRGTKLVLATQINYRGAAVEVLK